MVNKATNVFFEYLIRLHIYQF